MKALHKFFHSDAAGGIIMLLAAVAALVIANSPFYNLYESALSQTLTMGFTTPEGAPAFALQKPLILWINDLLMAIFFLFAGLEIKRELLAGALASFKTALLPMIAAICGMAIPAVVYLFILRDQPQYGHGWAISSATDIAFALGVLALLGSRVPASIKVLLMAIAVMDDLGAILVIAFFYAGAISGTALAVAGVAAFALLILNRLRVVAYGPYFLVGFVLWAALLKAGIHPTIGGVILGFAIPMRDEEGTYCPLETLEHIIKPWVVFAILPIFAFANAGVSFEGLGLSALMHPVTLAITAGLFLGKQLGIFGAIYGAVKTGLCPMPVRASWAQIYGMAMLCGIGFTMALFVGGLAFDDPSMAVYVRMGVIGGSALSALCGYGLLYIAVPRSSEGLLK